MTEDRSPRAFAAAWQPERAGRRAPKHLADAIVEPDWGGVRVAASLAADGASLWCDGEEIRAPEPLLAALVDAFRAVEAVVEGHLTAVALRSGEGFWPATPRAEHLSILVPRGFLRRGADDPFVRAREREAEAASIATAVLAAIAEGERHAFVATDLLWLDGEPLLDVPLLERKRHLDSVLEPSDLVRVTPFVRPSAAQTLVTWGTLEFRELTYRATNGRYLAGRENPDRVVARAPEGPRGASGGPAPRR